MYIGMAVNKKDEFVGFILNYGPTQVRKKIEAKGYKVYKEIVRINLVNDPRFLELGDDE